MRQRPQTLRTNARTRITAKIGHAGALTPNWETGRVKRTNERRRTRRAKVYGARSDGAICRGGYYRHWEVISVHKGYCNARSVHQLCPPSAHATHHRNNRDSRRPEASILLLSLAAHPTKPTCFFLAFGKRRMEGGGVCVRCHLGGRIGAPHYTRRLDRHSGL